jgi:hypothetical protein
VVEAKGRWVPLTGSAVRIRYAGLVSRALVDLPGDGGVSQSMEMSLGPAEDMLWVVLPEGRDALADELNSLMEGAIDYDRFLTHASWYTPIRALREAVEDAMAKLPAGRLAATRSCAALRQMIELSQHLGNYYLKPLQDQFHEHMGDGTVDILRTFDPELAAELRALAPDVALGRRHDSLPPVRPLAPDSELGRGWLEVEVRPDRRIVRTRYGGTISAVGFSIGSAGSDLALADIGIGPFEDTLWVLLPEFRPALHQFVRRELSEAMAAERTLRALPQDAVCGRLFDVVLRPVLSGAWESPGPVQRCLNAVHELIVIADEVGDTQRDALRREICEPLVGEPFRGTLAGQSPERLAEFERFMNRG